MSTRLEVINKMAERVASISIANGYNTDAGVNMLPPGEVPILGPDDPDEVAAITIGSAPTDYQGVNCKTTLPIQVQAVAKASLSAPWLAVETVISDIRKAVETDRDLGGLLIPRGLTRRETEVLEREPGSDTVGAGCAYELEFVEGWGG